MPKMAELNFNANSPFPPATQTTQTPSTPPHIIPGSPIDQFLSRTQPNLTTQGDAEHVTTSTNNPFELLPKPVTTFWPEGNNVVTVAEVDRQFPIEPVINPQYEIERKALIEGKSEIETPVRRGPGRPKGSGKPKEDAKLQSKVAYSRYLAVCQERKKAIAEWDKAVAEAWSAYLTSKV